MTKLESLRIENAKLKESRERWRTLEMEASAKHCELLGWATRVREALEKIASPCPIIEATPDELLLHGEEHFFKSTARRRDLAREAIAALDKLRSSK